MAVVTISREFGSEGNSIGTKVAEILGYKFVFKKEISEVFRQYGILEFEKIYHAEVDVFSRFDKARLETMGLLNRVVQAFAHRGNLVIMGRCGYAILEGLTDVLHVRIQAPLPIKVKRIMKENITEPHEVENLVKKEDRNRAKLLQVFYNSEWEGTSNFSLVIDTGKVSPDLAVNWIVEAVKNLDARKEYEEPNTRTIDVDPTLKQVIAQMIT